MRKQFITFGLAIGLLGFVACGNAPAEENNNAAATTAAEARTPFASQLQEGDIIFQSSSGSRADAIKAATHSRYSHVGILLEKDGQLMVFEAVQPVRYTPVRTWISRGEKSGYALKRLKDTAPLTPAAIQEMRRLADSWEGKNYDMAFMWGDDKLYCSELVWKLYDKGANFALCPVKKFSDYDFSKAIVQQEAQAQYGGKIPTEEPVVAPEDIWQSDKLESREVKL